jgi:hypothetical protein
MPIGTVLCRKCEKLLSIRGPADANADGEGIPLLLGYLATGGGTATRVSCG